MDRSASAQLIAESESLQFETLLLSRKTVRLRHEGRVPCTFCLHQDTTTTAKKLREIGIDVDSRNKGITVSIPGA